MSYLTFVASGLMAATAMQSGASEGAFPVMAGIKWRKEFHATITTPLAPADIVFGRTLWAIIRLAFILVVFAVISVLFGALEIGPALLAVPPAILTGVAFSTVVTAFTVTREDEQSPRPCSDSQSLRCSSSRGRFSLSANCLISSKGRLRHPPLPRCGTGAQSRLARGGPAGDDVDADLDPCASTCWR